MKVYFKKIAGVVVFSLGISALCAIAWEYANYILQSWQWTTVDIEIIIDGWLVAGLGILLVYKCGENLTIQMGHSDSQEPETGKGG